MALPHFFSRNTWEALSVCPGSRKQSKIPAVACIQYRQIIQITLCGKRGSLVEHKREESRLVFLLKHGYLDGSKLEARTELQSDRAQPILVTQNRLLLFRPQTT